MPCYILSLRSLFTVVTATCVGRRIAESANCMAVLCKVVSCVDDRFCKVLANVWLICGDVQATWKGQKDNGHDSIS